MGELPGPPGTGATELRAASVGCQPVCDSERRPFSPGALGISSPADNGLEGSFFVARISSALTLIG